ncbi:hypothetical protein PVL29_019671 [Vitis rotundifolia]|uniref:Uncharacterized protein n=1 Tax=Vitis rotundifolia TaxID=103349 RepID=A0AA38Z1J2_VITRO|nr:hypothetical protein PVL29_019671 [Vitis rotundifolia]
MEQSVGEAAVDVMKYCVLSSVLCFTNLYTTRNSSVSNFMVLSCQTDPFKYVCDTCRACHFMDKNAPGMTTSEDVTRESLIAISNSVPDQALPSEPKTLNTENLVKGANCDNGSEKYRSQLISISNVQSPETKTSPAALGEPKG